MGKHQPVKRASHHSRISSQAKVCKLKLQTMLVSLILSSIRSSRIASSSKTTSSTDTSASTWAQGSQDTALQLKIWTSQNGLHHSTKSNRLTKGHPVRWSARSEFREPSRSSLGSQRRRNRPGITGRMTSSRTSSTLRSLSQCTPKRRSSSC